MGSILTASFIYVGCIYIKDVSSMAHMEQYLETILFSIFVK